MQGVADEMNNFSIKIDGVDYTKKATFPLKWADLLDERLDECRVTLKNLTIKEPFLPLTEIIITLTNAPECKVGGTKSTNSDIGQSYNSSTKRLTQTLEKRYVLASDTVNNYPVGSKFYTHELYFIEETKLLEGYICDSLTFVNPLGSVYIKTP